MRIAAERGLDLAVANRAADSAIRTLIKDDHILRTWGMDVRAGSFDAPAENR